MSMLRKTVFGRKLLTNYFDQFYLDSSSIKNFRIGFAAVLLWDLLIRVGDLAGHYTDSGIVPRTSLLFSPWNIAESFSLHMLSGSTFVVSLIFLIHGSAIIGFLVNYKTRLMATVLFILTVSLHNRNPYVLNGVDTVIRLAIFLAIFVNYSDQQNRKRTSALPFLILIFCIYTFNGLNKLDNATWIEGRAVFDAMNIHHFRTIIGEQITHFPALSKWLTWPSLLLELVGSALMIALFPLRSLRKLLVVSFMVFHLSIAVTLSVGLFPYIMIAVLLVLYPITSTDPYLTPGYKIRGFHRSSIFALVAALYMLGLNLVEPSENSPWDSWQNRYYWNPVTTLLRFDQHWIMFDNPSDQIDGWLVASQEGQDLATGKPLSTDPNSGFQLQPNDRWIKVVMLMAKGDYRLADDYHQWFCRSQPSVNPSLPLDISFLKINKPQFPEIKPYTVEKINIVSRSCQAY